MSWRSIMLVHHFLGIFSHLWAKFHDFFFIVFRVYQIMDLTRWNTQIFLKRLCKDICDELGSITYNLVIFLQLWAHFRFYTAFLIFVCISPWIYTLKHPKIFSKSNYEDFCNELEKYYIQSHHFSGIFSHFRAHF